MKKAKFVLLILIAVVNFNLNANSPNDYLDTKIFNSCDFQNDKYYIAPGLIYISPKGIYININGNMVPVSKIEADNVGVYITGIVDRCPMCKWPTIGGFCINPDCPSKG